MSGKSRHEKGKHSARSKRRKDRQHFSATVIQQQSVTETQKPVASPIVATPSASIPTQTPTPTAVTPPYILTELRRIGILAGIMLAILIVLALVLS